MPTQSAVVTRASDGSQPSPTHTYSHRVHKLFLGHCQWHKNREKKTKKQKKTKTWFGYRTAEQTRTARFSPAGRSSTNKGPLSHRVTRVGRDTEAEGEWGRGGGLAPTEVGPWLVVTEGRHFSSPRSTPRRAHHRGEDTDRPRRNHGGTTTCPGPSAAALSR